MSRTENEVNIANDAGKKRKRPTHVDDHSGRPRLYDGRQVDWFHILAIESASESNDTTDRINLWLCWECTIGALHQTCCGNLQGQRVRRVGGWQVDKSSKVYEQVETAS